LAILFSDSNTAPHLDSNSIPTALQEIMLDCLPSDTLKVAAVTTSKATKVSLSLISHVGAFRTTVQGKCSFKPEETTLQALKSVRELKAIAPYDFEKEDDQDIPHILITDYIRYHSTKHSCFVQWLEANYKEVFETENRENNVVDFVSFNGRIADPLLTPLLPSNSHWEVYGINIKNVIYLWSNPTHSEPTSKAGMQGLLFERLVSSHSNYPIVETDKVSLCRVVLES